MYARAAAAYRRVYLESASPSRIVDELFCRLLSDCEEAAALMGAGDLSGKGSALGHALAIVDELSASLDAEAAPDLCGNLARLYDYVRGRLIAANLRLEPRLLDEAERVVRVLREAFHAAAPQATPQATMERP